MNRDHRDTPTSWPSADLAAELFLRLTVGNPRDISTFIEAYLDPLIAFLRSAHPGADDHTRQTVAEDALISLCKCPAQYTPSRGALAAYLRMSATGDLKNLLDRERKRCEKQKHWDCVEDDVVARNSDDEGDDFDLPSFDRPAIAAVIRGFSEEERKVFELMRAGERCNEVFAAALGWANLSRDEQSDRVKRVKDRIKQRLKRAVEGLS
jgi:RNA polymerase sigma factor (sigma-70 family)